MLEQAVGVEAAKLRRAAEVDAGVQGVRLTSAALARDEHLEFAD